jgi:hypothetical protein
MTAAYLAKLVVENMQPLETFRRVVLMGECDIDQIALG